MKSELELREVGLIPQPSLQRLQPGRLYRAPNCVPRRPSHQRIPVEWDPRGTLHLIMEVA